MRGAWLKKLCVLSVLLGSWSLVLAQETLQETQQEAAGIATDEPAAPATAETTAARTATAIVPGSELESMTGPLIRMIVSLAAVLAFVGLFAWLAKRFRGGQLQGGLIQIVSGLSLGPKEKVVLLRVGDEEILVGMSPAGMQQLHVLNSKSKRFSLDMANGDAKD